MHLPGEYDQGDDEHERHADDLGKGDLADRVLGLARSLPALTTDDQGRHWDVYGREWVAVTTRHGGLSFALLSDDPKPTPAQGLPLLWVEFYRTDHRGPPEGTPSGAG